MKEARFLVQGSTPDLYKVHFLLDGQNLSAVCTCPAGENGQYCEHRFSIMSGNKKGIVSENIDQVDEVASWMLGMDVGEIRKEVKGVDAQ